MNSPARQRGKPVAEQAPIVLDCTLSQTVEGISIVALLLFSSQCCYGCLLRFRRTCFGRRVEKIIYRNGERSEKEMSEFSVEKEQAS